MVIFLYNLYIFGIHLRTVFYPKLCYNELCYKEVVVDSDKLLSLQLKYFFIKKMFKPFLLLLFRDESICCRYSLQALLHEYPKNVFVGN